MPSRPSTPRKSAGSARDDERAEKTTEILKKIRTLEIKTRGLVETAFAGNYHSVFKGRGMNFEDVREYQPGDEIRAIDWNVTARMGSAFVKKFTEERELTVMLVVDVSASGNFGSTTQSKRELAAEVACLLAFSAIRNNDKVGLITFTDEVVTGAGRTVEPHQWRIRALWQGQFFILDGAEAPADLAPMAPFDPRTLDLEAAGQVSSYLFQEEVGPTARPMSP